MSAVAPAATPPPAVSGVSEGRAKRKISKPNRFTSPPPAKRARPNPPAAGSKPAAAAKKSVTSRSSKAGRSKPPAVPAPRPAARGKRPDASAPLSAIALAALSSPGAAALIGQSPVPESAVVEAMAAAAAAREITSPGSGALAGLAMLLEATEESPTLARDLGVAANMLPKGSRPRQNPAASPLRPVNLNAAGDDGTRRHPTAPDAPRSGWGDGKRRRDGDGKRRRAGGGVAKAAEDEGAAPSRAARTRSDPVVAALAAERARAAVTAVTAKEFDATVHAVATTQPRAVLGHALSWLNLLVGDLKGRSAALRRSRRRLQKVRAEVTERAEAARSERGVPAKDEPPLLEEKEAGLLEDLERALAVEDKHLTALLKQAMQAQGVARGSDAGGREEGGSSSRDGGGKGSEKKKSKPGKAKDVAAKGVAPAILGAPPEHDDPKLMTDYFANAMITSAAAFLSTGLNVAVADGDGDGKAAAAVACPAGLVPTPHIAAA